MRRSDRQIPRALENLGSAVLLKVCLSSLTNDGLLVSGIELSTVVVDQRPFLGRVL